MHGRLKVKDSAEKAAEKAKEREKKRKKYLSGINILFSKRTAAEHNADSLAVSAALLQANPDALTLWNIRRETLLALRSTYINTGGPIIASPATETKPHSGEVITESNEAATPILGGSTTFSEVTTPCNDILKTSSGVTTSHTDVQATSSQVTPSSNDGLVTSSEVVTIPADDPTASTDALDTSSEATTSSRETRNQSKYTAKAHLTNTAATDAAVQPTAAPDRGSLHHASAVAYPSLPSSWAALLKTELSVVAACLQYNPKSYGAWHHREWVMQQLCDEADGDKRQQAWDEELNLCNLFLKKDERNFHCWDYRRVVVRHGGVPPTSELRYSLQLIEGNLSNYSAWHYRAKLLPLLHPPLQGSPHPVTEAVFGVELQRVVHAVFTDPSDQSPWFFLRWLLQQRRPLRPRPLVCGVCRVSPTRLLLVCSYTAPVACAALPCLAACHAAWRCGDSGRRASVWSTELAAGDCGTSIALQFPPTDGQCAPGEAVVAAFSLASVSAVGSNASAWLTPPCERALPQQSKDALEELLENCRLLDDEDPGNKWVLLTLVETLWALGGSSHRQAAQDLLTQLRTVDPLRCGYYDDMKSKLLLEELSIECVRAAPTEQLLSFDGGGRGLCLANNLQFLSCCPRVDLSHNPLRGGASLAQLLLCRDLVLDGTAVEDLGPVATLPNLRALSLNSCSSVASVEAVRPLAAMPTLDSLSLKGNFNEDVQRVELKELFKHVRQLEL